MHSSPSNPLFHLKAICRLCKSAVEGRKRGIEFHTLHYAFIIVLSHAIKSRFNATKREECNQPDNSAAAAAVVCSKRCQLGEFVPKSNASTLSSGLATAVNSSWPTYSRLFSSFSFLFKLFICYVFEKRLPLSTDFACDFVYDLLLRTSKGMEQDCSNPQVYPQSAKRVGHTHILLWEWSDPSIYPLTSSMEPMTSWRVGLSDQGGELAQLHIVERMDGNISHWESFAKEVCSISRSLKAWLVASCSSNSCAKLASSVCTLCFGSILIQLLLFAKTMFCHLGLSYARALEIVAPTCRPNRGYVGGRTIH